MARETPLEIATHKSCDGTGAASSDTGPRGICSVSPTIALQQEDNFGELEYLCILYHFLKPFAAVVAV